MKKLIILLTSIIFAIAIQDGYSKILVICDRSNAEEIQVQLNQYINDIINFDNKHVEYLAYSGVSGTNITQCMDLRSYIEASYSSGISSNDPLEGAVLIGNLPVPQYEYTTSNGSISYWPFDYYYLDIWNTQSMPPAVYSNHGMPQPFSEDPNNPGYFNKTYTGGDNIYDIWISRIYGPQLSLDGHLRSSAQGGNPNTVLDESGIYQEYLNRLHQRYTAPATAPYRGFAMGGTLDDISVSELGMSSLPLPMYVEFNSSSLINTGEASPFNWMSQLQAGPKGETNYGAYNGTIFPNQRNARNCQYSQLKDARTIAPYSGRTYSNLDNNGWEWAGIFGHSSPTGTCFLAVSSGPNFNGGFGVGTLGPFWGNTSTTYTNNPIGYVPTDGTNPSGYYYHYDVNGIATDPFSWGVWRAKYAEFRYIIKSSGTYTICLNYNALGTNCNDGQVNLYVVPVNTSNGQINGTCSINQTYSMGYGSTPNMLNMETHSNPYGGSGNWEEIFTNVQLSAPGNMAIIEIFSNGQSGDVPADAVRFISPSVDYKVDNAAPTTIPVGPGGGAIYSTQGFFTDDWIERSFLSMQDEDGTNHNKFSKTPFFLTNACEINDFIYINPTMDNMGNLYALGHNGLICLGTSDCNWTNWDYSTFLGAIAAGNDFGQSFLTQANIHVFPQRYDPNGDPRGDGLYCLLGSGTLRAQPYIQYGSLIEQNLTVSSAVTINSANPVLIQGVTVSASGGNYTVNSTVTTSPPQQCGHSEVVIRGETVFTKGCTADIKAN